MRPRGRGVVVIVIAALLAPALADADDLGGATSASLAVIGSTDRPVVPTILMADCFCNASVLNQILGRPPEWVGSGLWSTNFLPLNEWWSISARRLRPPITSLANRLALYDAERADVAVEADMVRVNAARTLGLVARGNGELNSSTTMRRLQVVVASGRAVLSAWIGTSETVLADVDATFLPLTYRLRMEVVGSAVRVSVGTAVLIDLTLPAPLDGQLATGTYVGAVATNASTERLDDVLVTTWPP